MRKSHTYLLCLILAIFLIMSLPKGSVDKIRGNAIAFFAPLFNKMTGFVNSDKEELERLKIEHQLLQNEITSLKKLFRKQKLLTQEISKTIEVLPARIIFRSPTTWSSSLWINVGRADNANIGRDIVAKNSPVLSDASVVGVIDYVGEHQSRVRLITDSGLSPSVRAKRQDGKLLAKGELQGGSKPLWRSQGQTLKGIGFNYDFADEQGPARDLRTGMPLNSKEDQSAIPLLKVNDLLVTTGMDGVFPAGLKVATVTKIEPLKEGDYYYELEAVPTAEDLNELNWLFVIPPLGYNPSDQPPYLGH